MKSLLFALLLLPVAVGAQIINTIAGLGTFGVLGDGGPAISAELTFPHAVATDTAGCIFISDLSHSRIRKISESGIITTIAGTGVMGCTGDGGPATVAQISRPHGVIADKRGNIFFCDYGCNVVRKINALGIISTIAGNGTGGYSGDGGQATAASISDPRDIAVDTAGNIFFTEQTNNVLRKVNTSGIISTVGGTGTAGFSGDSGPASAAQLHYPVGVTCDNSGNLFIADWRNYRIRKINAAGIITTIAGNGSAGITGDGGPATAALLDPSGNLCFDQHGNLISVDPENHVVRFITPFGIINRIAGTGTSGFSGDGGPATAAALAGPCGVAVNAAGDIFIAEISNNRIRKISESIPLGAGTLSFKNEVSIFPNPASSTITVSSSQIIKKITIANLQGQTVYSAESSANNLSVDVSGLRNGVYFIRINGNESRLFVKSE